MLSTAWSTSRFALVRTCGWCATTRGGLTTTEAFDALLDAARRMPDLAAVILDPLNLLHGADVERNEGGRAVLLLQISPARQGKRRGYHRGPP